MKDLLSRFPALRQLGSGGRGRIPFVQQLTATECGAASLAMVLGYYGKNVSLDDVREILGPGRDGLNALGLINAGEHHGLRGRGVRVDLEELEYLGPGAILHWRFEHFVVLEKVSAEGIDIVDPALGRRHVSMAEVNRQFTGVALLFEPGDHFQTAEKRQSGVWGFGRRLLGEHRGLLAQIVVISLLLQIIALAVPVLTSLVVDGVVARGDEHLLTVVSVGMLGILVFQFASTYLRAHLLLALRTHLDTQMTLSFVEHLMGLPYSFFQTRPAGDLLTRMSSNAVVRDIMTTGALSAFLDGGMVVFYLAILFWSSPIMGAVAIGLGFLYLLVYLGSRRQKRELASQAISKQARAHGYEMEMLTGMDTLKSIGAEQRATEAWSHLFVDLQNSALTRGKLDAAVDSIMSALRFASPLAILAVGAQQVLDGKLSLGNMLALNAVAAGFLTPLSALIGTAMSLATVTSHVERIDDVLRAEPEQDRTVRRGTPKLTGAISLHKVGFRYSPLAPLVVKDVTLDIKPGMFVGVVGKTGAGKSTMLSLLSGLHQPTMGRILFDGYALTDLDMRSVRRQLGVVTQSPYLFGTTIRANISLGDPHASFEDIKRAAVSACIHEEIRELPMGYDTPLADRGASLSGGQRQRIALARALLGKPAVLILDEATSALDGITERGVQNELARLNMTRVVIAHRLSTVRYADLIVVMEDGAVVEAGTHEQLLQREGVYYRLVFPA